MLVVTFIAIVVVAFLMLSKEEAQLTPLRNALRETHAQGQESGPVVRAWRIEMARAHKVSTTQTSNASTTKTTAGAIDPASVFTLTANSTSKLQSEAVMMRALNDDACAAVSADTVKLQLSGSGDRDVDDTLSGKDSVTIMTDAQRGARFALLLEQGHDITTTGLAATVSATQSADEIATVVIADAQRHAKAQAQISGDKLDVDLTPIDQGDFVY